MPKTAEQRIIRVPADHPAWNAIDDDDWSGHTFVNWIQCVKDRTVVIWPPADYRDRLGRFLMALLNAGAERIVSGASYPADSGDVCHDCLPFRDTLRRLADAAEAAVIAPRSLRENIMNEFETSLGEARVLLGEARTKEPK